MSVYDCIWKIQVALSKEGIAKGQRNAQQGYNFRGIDDFLAALSPLLAEYGLLITPYLQERTMTEYQSKQGGALFNTCVVVDYQLRDVAEKGGEPHIVRVPGEAMDSGDKGTNKAMSSAYKNMAIQTFCIATRGDNDSENQTHEVSASKSVAQQVSTVGRELPLCPGCGTNTSVMRSKFKGPAYVCFTGKGGCGVKFDSPPESVTETDSYPYELAEQEVPF